jgi:hypothetical protein
MVKLLIDGWMGVAEKGYRTEFTREVITIFASRIYRQLLMHIMLSFKSSRS